MFAESPGINAVEHPVFDVWLTDCEKPKPDDAEQRRAEQHEAWRGMQRGAAGAQASAAPDTASTADETAPPRQRASGLASVD